MMVKKFLFIMRASPHHGIHLQEKLDVILTTAAFDQKLTLLFLDDGIFQLKKNQQPETQSLKDTLCIFNALEMYDVSDYVVEIESMQERGVNQSELNLPVSTLYRTEINVLMKQYDIIIS